VYLVCENISIPHIIAGIAFIQRGFGTGEIIIITHISLTYLSFISHVTLMQPSTRVRRVDGRVM